MGGGSAPKVDPVQQQRLKDQLEAERFDRKQQQLRDWRNKDFEEGRKRGEEIFGEGKLGRVNATRSSDVADIIARRKDAMNGLDSQEQQALREKAINEIGGNQTTSLRSLAVQQARNGVRGPVASSQAAKVIADSNSAKTGAERDLYLKNIDLKRDALNSAEKSIRDAETDELGKQTYNIGQGNKEKYGALATEMGFASLGAGERAGIMEALIGEKQADAASKMKSGKK